MSQNKTSFTSLFALIALVATGHFLIDFMLSIWPVYKTLAHLDIGIAGLIAVVAISSGELMQLFFGKLIDKGHAKKLLIIGPLLGSAAIFFPYVSTYMAFFFLLLCTTIGSAAFHPTAASVLGAIITPRRALIMGIFQMSGNFGLGFGQLFFTTTYEILSGHTAILIIPAVVLGCVIISASIKAQEPTKEHISFATIARFFKHPTLRNLYFIQLCHQTVLWSTVFLLPDLLVARGYSTTIALGGGHLALLSGAALGCLPAGFLGDRFSPAKTIVSGYILSFIALYTLLFQPALSVGALLSVLFFFGASLGPMTPLSLAVGTGTMPELRGMVSAFLMGLVWIVSETIGIGFSGILADCFASDGPMKALSCIGLYLVAGSYFAFSLISEEHRAQSAELS